MLKCAGTRTRRLFKCAVLIVLLLALVPALTGRAAAAGACFNDTTAARAKGTVVLDPGHGAEDPGTSNTTSNGTLLLEKHLNLSIAERTRDVLVGKGYRVCMTRVDDSTNPSNTQRAEYANSVGGNVLVLVHLNGSSDPTTNYTQTFWGKRNKDLFFSQWMYNALYPALDDVNWDGVRDYQVGGAGVGQFASGALLKSTMPATLTESIFLTNDQEADRLLDSGSTGRRQQIATKLAEGIDSWLSQ